MPLPRKASCVLAVAALLVPGGVSVEEAVAQRDLPAEKLEAEVEKLREETAQIESEGGFVDDVVDLAPLITALVALGGLFVTLWKQRQEMGRQRELDREERAQARVQRFDEQFQQIAENLGAGDGIRRAAAAAAIEMFMRPEHEEMHDRVFFLLLAALRFPKGDFGDRILIRTFEKIAPTRIPAMRRQGSKVGLDLSRCELTRVNLSEVDLSEVDLAFAKLHDARLVGVKLWRVEGIGVDLSDAHLRSADLREVRMTKANLCKARLYDADMVSAKLKEADATRTVFCGARMQEVNLDKAKLHGARFEGATLTNAFFRGARFDEAALRSIALGALEWRRANWDAETRAELERISSEQ